MPKSRKIRRAAGSSRHDALQGLYKEPLPASRTDALYSAFAYPTKISPEAIALFIAAHTKPGDTIFDGFAGSGTTGLAALLCENPSVELREKAKRLGLRVRWGSRNAVLYELGALGAFIGHTLTNPPDPKAFRKAAEEILSATERSEGWMYHAKDPAGNLGAIRHLIWTDELGCPSCGQQETLWDSCVSLRPARISGMFTCRSCGHKAALDEVERLTETTYDDVLEQHRKLRLRSPIRVYGVTGKKTWSRPASRGDLALLKKISHEPIPETVPRVAIPWGDLYRSGYHQGMTHLHHFYTRRNLIVFVVVAGGDAAPFRRSGVGGGGDAVGHRRPFLAPDQIEVGFRGARLKPPADALDLIHGNGRVGHHALDDLHGVAPAQIAGKMHRPSTCRRRRGAVVLGHRVGSSLAKACNSLMQVRIRRHFGQTCEHTPTRSEIVASVKHARRNAKALAVPAFPRPPFALSCGVGANLPSAGVVQW
jgi:hypothetical protein